MSKEKSKIQFQEGMFYIGEGVDRAELTYTLSENDVMRVDHTFVPDSLRGKGIAKDLVLEALAYAKSHKYKIHPVCSYVVTFFKRHPEHKGVLSR